MPRPMPSLMNKGFAPAVTVALALCSLIATAQTPLPNPDLPVKCPYDIIFVLDESASIMGDPPFRPPISPQIRSGARDLITLLSGTGSRVAVVEFNSTARRAPVNGSINYQMITPAYVAAFNSYVSQDNNGTPDNGQYDPEDCTQCWTNWEDALVKVQNINSTEGVADIVIFFTDGNPTAYINTNGWVTQGNGQAIAQQALLDAIGAANVVKTQGSHIFVVGVPNPVLPEPNVQDISGPDRYPSPEASFLKGDYMISNSATLQQALAGLAALLTTNVASSGFSYSLTWSNSCDTFMVRLMNESTRATSVFWSIGDSTYSSDTSITHLFTGGGPFVVMIAARNDGPCGVSDTLYDTLSFPRILDTMFTAFDSSFVDDCDSLLVNFSGTSSQSATFRWHFGNGESASGNNASVIYASPGTYNVTMIADPVNWCYAADTLVKPFTFTPVFYPSQAGFDYSISYKNDCDTFMVEFTNTATGATDYYWDFGNGSFSTDTSLTHLFTDGGPFVVMLSAFNEGECGISDTLYDTLSFTIIPDTLVTGFTYSFTPDCDSLVVAFTDTSGVDATITWDFGNGATATGAAATAMYPTPGTYLVTMMSSANSGCYVDDTATLPFTFTPLSITAQAGFRYDVLYRNDCDTFMVKFINESTGGTSYLWDLGNGEYTSDTNTVVTYPAGAFVATLHVNDHRNCATGDTLSRPLAFTPVVTRPEADFSYNIVPSCDLVELSLENLSTGTREFSWKMNSTVFSSDVAPNSPLMYYKADTLAIELVARGINNCALDDTASKLVTLPAPYGYAEADFEFSPAQPEVDEVVSFTNFSRGAHSGYYRWEFGDGNTSSEVHPQHTYTRPDQYVICLSADNGFGCPGTACKDIPLTLTALVDLPNAFTPNGDDNNDVFRVRGENILDMHLRIFNRWGQLVFESRDPLVGWDGSYKGHPQEMEVYDWLLNATLKGGKDVFRKGNVTLLR